MRDVPDPVEDVLRWLLAVVDRLTLAAADTRRAAAGIARCWSDARGQDWVERMGLVERRLERDAATCAALVARLSRDLAGLPMADPAEPGTELGTRLGSTAGRRVDNARGMRIATLTGEEPPGGR